MKRLLFPALLATAAWAQTVPPTAPLALSLKDAINRGIKTNLRALLSTQDVRSAQGARLLALSRLMPKVSVTASETSQQVNLAAFGFSGFPGIPSTVGPFGISDLRANVSQPLLNFRSIYAERSAIQQEKAAGLSASDARDAVALLVTNLYLQASSASSRIDSGKARVATAQATYEQALDFQKNGVVPAIEVMRAQVELQTQQQHLIACRSDVEKLKLQLAQAIGLPDGQTFELSDKLPFAPLTGLSADEAISKAWQSRPDYQSAAARVDAAMLTRKSVEALRLPTAEFNGNYGTIGPNPANLHGTFAAGVSVNIPIFQGGRVKGELTEVDAELERRKAELADMRSRITLEIRTAYLDLNSASEQTQVATKTVELAHQALTQAQDRFAAGVSNNLEVIQAQEAVSTADENYIANLYRYNAARALLARSMGHAETSIPAILQGVSQ